MLVGARKLAQAPGSQQEKAARCGVSQQAVSGWLAYGAVPIGRTLLIIEREYGIPLQDWLVEEAGEPPATERAS
mgnify:CR=1